MNFNKVAKEMSIKEIITELRSSIGEKMLVYVMEIDPQDLLVKWEEGKIIPSKDQERKLRDIMEIYLIFTSVDSKRLFPHWMIGMNPDLEEEAPVMHIRNDNMISVKNAVINYINF